jgi:myo-inositol 2-dehydrogenase/D-chiro-inositol 1-dehydrogenase
MPSAAGPFPSPTSTGVSRRGFTASVGAIAAAGTFVDPVARMAHGAESGILKVGIVGCGGRGSGAAVQAMSADPGNVLHAIADPFPDKLESGANILGRAAEEKAKKDPQFAKRFDCPADRRFPGLDGYKRLIDCCDVVLLATPPAFRPMHLRAAVEAGKHVFCEKPVAVDPAGLRHVAESVEIAKRNKRSLVSGFCWRYHTRMRDVFKRIAEGAMGPVRSAYTTYNAAGWRGEVPKKPDWSDMEYQIRNWQYYTWLSGDHIAEQAVHSLDRLIWAFGDEMPVSVLCTGGRELRGDRPVGNNVFDHFVAAYEWADGRRGFHMCRHFPNCASDNSDYITGADGTAVVNGFANLQRIVTPGGTWDSEAEKNDMYQQEHDDLFGSIRAGTPINDGSILLNATALAIMARMSAYTGQPVTLEQLENSKESLVPDPLALDAAPPATPVAVPGRTKTA